MKQSFLTPEQYQDSLPEDRRNVISTLRTTLLNNLPEGFSEVISYGMIGYVVPHTIYPAGYHCDPKLPLPFISIASQKNFVSFYHMGVYMDENLLNWFVSEYGKHTSGKLDMGKSCIRFKKMDQIPYDLLGELAAKWSPQHWITVYEQQLKKSKNK